MDDAGALSWVALLTLLVSGPTPSRHGVIRRREGLNPSERYHGWARFAGDPQPVFAAPTDELTRVWCDGARTRLEGGDGQVHLIVGDELCWQFRAGDPVPVASPASAVVYRGGIDLLRRRDANDFAGDDFTRPAGPVGTSAFLGRPAYTVELAPPAHKPFPLQLVVDAETGLILQQRNDDFGSAEEWIELVLGDDLDPGLFRWDGPARAEADERAERDRGHEQDMAARADWFRGNVAALPVPVEFALDVLVHEHADDGSFQASLGANHAMLARRPRSDQDWHLGWSQVQHRWSDERWDWALTSHRDPITAAGLQQLAHQLANGPA